MNVIITEKNDGKKAYKEDLTRYHERDESGRFIRPHFDGVAYNK